MDDLVKDSIRIVHQKTKNTVPWELDQPAAQPCYSWNETKWQQVTTEPIHTNQDAPKLIALYSWNIDFMLPYPDSRMRAGLRHLERLIAKQPSSAVIIIYLNECVESDLRLMATDPWVQKTFAITDLDNTNWQSGHYGTTTLIDRRLPVQSCFRVHYAKSNMERDGLFVDVAFRAGKPIRFCNTHAESLANEPAFRPPQIALCAEYMHSPDVQGAILAGDLNAIQDFDKHLHTDNNLQDAYLEMGGSEDDAENGHTWGQQAATAQRMRFGTTRMDKVFYCGGVTCKSFDRFGQDIEVEDKKEREAIVKLGFKKPWITDHLGVMATFEVQS
ncbi:hypothetical protein LTR86_002160 [Recurvomyces mirabilis]|nr:hypothetical protein LTR86_002160 [Recurvomyces mirabilis]